MIRRGSDDEYAAFVRSFPAAGLFAGGNSREHGVDHYGYEMLHQRLHALGDGACAMIARLFAVALVDSATHCYAPHLRRFLDAPVMILNGYNILTTAASNYTHTWPQSFLGLYKDWTKEDLAVLRTAMRAEF
jgi:hypothetical protein